MKKVEDELKKVKERADIEHYEPKPVYANLHPASLNFSAIL